jgi:hypothetical protein
VIDVTFVNEDFFQYIDERTLRHHLGQAIKELPM